MQTDEILFCTTIPLNALNEDYKTLVAEIEEKAQQWAITNTALKQMFALRFCILCYRFIWHIFTGQALLSLLIIKSDPIRGYHGMPVLWLVLQFEYRLLWHHVLNHGCNKTTSMLAAERLHIHCSGSPSIKTMQDCPKRNHPVGDITHIIWSSKFIAHGAKTKKYRLH